MATAKEQLLKMMSPNQARLLDQQMRDQQVAQRSQGAGMLSGLVQAYTGMGDILQRSAGISPMGANEAQAIAQNELRKKQEEESVLNLQAMKKRAVDAIYANPSIGAQPASNLLNAIDKDSTGAVAKAVFDKYGMPDLPSEDKKMGFASINVGGVGYIYSKEDGSIVRELGGGEQDVAGGSSRGGTGANSKSSSKTKDTLETIAKDTIKSITTDKDVDVEVRGKMLKEIASFRKNNPDAGVLELSNHLSDEFQKQLDISNAVQAEKARKLMNTDILRTLDTIDVIAENAEDVGSWEYLFAQYLPGTQAKDIKVNLQNLFAKISFDRLQRMREESKTGGALGNVSNFEIGLLQNSLKALDPESPSFRENLQKVKKYYESVMFLYSGNEEKAIGYIEKSPDYLIDPDTNEIFYTRDPDEPFVLVGKLGE